MPNVGEWERRFVDSYVEKSVRPRYLGLLTGVRSRRKLLDRLNHNSGFDFSKARELGSIDEKGLLRLLKSRKVQSSGHFLADNPDLDGQELNLDYAVQEFLRSHSGAVLICPPKPIAVYREEAPGAMYLFE